MRTHLTIATLIEEIAEGIKDPGINLRDIIRRSAKIIPKTLPGYMRFIGELSGGAEIREIAKYNQLNNKKITIEEVYLGVPSKDAEIYMAEKKQR